MNKQKKNELRKLRQGFDQNTNIYRLIHGSADRWKGLYVDRLGDYLLIQSPQSLTEKQKEETQELQHKLKLKGIINSGMIPKIDNCFDALKNGVKTIKIGSIKMINKARSADSLNKYFCNNLLDWKPNSKKDIVFSMEVLYYLKKPIDVLKNIYKKIN